MRGKVGMVFEGFACHLNCVRLFKLLTNGGKEMLFISPFLIDVVNLIEPHIYKQYITIKCVNGLWYAEVK